MSGSFIVNVIGNPRCGSSLTMQMLDAGGFPCLGTWPAFEEYSAPQDEWAAYTDFRDMAVKTLDAIAVVGPPPPMEAEQRFILLRRDYSQQVRSFVKFCRATGVPVESGAKRTALAHSFGVYMRTLGYEARKTGPVLEVCFEDLLKDPRTTAATIAAFVAPCCDQIGLPRLDEEAMAAQAVRRSPKNYNGLLEAELLASRGLS